MFGAGKKEATPTVEQVREAIQPVIDPELGISIVDLGLIYDIAAADGRIDVTMTLTSPFCPLGPMLKEQIDDAVRALPGAKKVNIEFVWTPPWDPRTMASEEARDILGIW